MKRCFIGDCKGICSSCVGSYPSSSVLGDSSSEKGKPCGSDISRKRSPHTSKVSKLNGIISSILTESNSGCVPVSRMLELPQPGDHQLEGNKPDSQTNCRGDTSEWNEPPRTDSQQFINRNEVNDFNDENLSAICKKGDSQQAISEKGKSFSDRRFVHPTYSAQMTRKSSSSGTRHFPGCPKLFRSRCSSDQKILEQESVTQGSCSRCVPNLPNFSETKQEALSFQGNLNSRVSLTNTTKDRGSVRNLRRRRHLRQIIIEPGQVNPNEVTVITIEDDDSWDDSETSTAEEDILPELRDCQVRNLVAQRCTKRSSSATHGLIKTS